VPVLLDGETTVSDSWNIALYLDETYPRRPALFGSADARAEGFFIKRWCELTLHPALVRLIVADIVQILDPRDRDYFRQSRETALGMPLEDYGQAREESLKALDNGLAPLRSSLETTGFLGGEAPNFADYTVFGALQWARCSSRQTLLQPEDPVTLWFDKLLALYDGLGAKAPRGKPG